MSANHPPTPAAPIRIGRTPLLLGLALLLVAVAAGVALFAVRRSSPAAAVRHPAAPPLSSAATWAAGAKPAPDFQLADEHGTPFRLRDLRGRTVIVTFIDPLCRNFCPLEAKVLNEAVRSLPAAQRPAIVSVSVNPWGDTRTAFREDATHWQLGADWRWGVGSYGRLAQVWKRYGIGVEVASKTVAGVTVRNITHTEAAYVIDKRGDERALFLYPFRAADVARVVRGL
jgi:cytochrome oxidase Cu insertion factor (SCO1/SenC/PrrC family)